MVGIGEFSPNNLRLCRAGRSVLCFDEYDEQRKLLMAQQRNERGIAAEKVRNETIKEEARSKKRMMVKKEEDTKKKPESEESDVSGEENGRKESDLVDKVDDKKERSDEEIADREENGERAVVNQPPHSQAFPVLPEWSKPDAEVIEDLKRWEQENYKKELDEQIKEKEALRQMAKEAECREEEERERIFQEQTRRLRDEYEREISSRRFFVYQRRKRAEMLKQRLEELQKEAEERRRMKRAEKLRLGAMSSQEDTAAYNKQVTLGKIDNIRPLSPLRLSSPTLFAHHRTQNFYQPKVSSLNNHLKTTDKPKIDHHADGLIIDAPHDLSVNPTLVPVIEPTFTDPNVMPLPSLQSSMLSNRLQKINSPKSYVSAGTLRIEIEIGNKRSKDFTPWIQKVKKNFESTWSLSETTPIWEQV